MSMAALATTAKLWNQVRPKVMSGEQGQVGDEGGQAQRKSCTQEVYKPDRPILGTVCAYGVTVNVILWPQAQTGASCSVPGQGDDDLVEVSLV